MWTSGRTAEWWWLYVINQSTQCDFFYNKILFFFLPSFYKIILTSDVLTSVIWWKLYAWTGWCTEQRSRYSFVRACPLARAVGSAEHSEILNIIINIKKCRWQKEEAVEGNDWDIRHVHITLLVWGRGVHSGLQKACSRMVLQAPHHGANQHRNCSHICSFPADISQSLAQLDNKTLFCILQFLTHLKA